MGRAFEKRKHVMFARYDRLAKAFTRIGREIAIAVKSSGPLPEYNPRLRAAIQSAKGVNMPKERIDAAIKRASNRDEKGFEEVVYEGYGPHAVGVICECATDNPTRTIANVRLGFSKSGGVVGKTGSLDFMFERKGVFKLKKDNINVDEFEFELIDQGLEELFIDDEENQLIIHTAFTDFSSMQKYLEEKKYDVIFAELERIPSSYVELNEQQQEEIIKMVERLEQDDDVQKVYHNMK